MKDKIEEAIDGELNKSTVNYHYVNTCRLCEHASHSVSGEVYDCALLKCLVGWNGLCNKFQRDPTKN